MIVYAKRYISFLSSIPDILLKGGADMLERIQGELGNEVTQQEGRNEESDDIYKMP